MANNSEISNRLREFGEKKYSTLTEFARVLGIKPQNLANYLSGVRRPGNKMRFRLRELGCDIDWLMTGRTEIRAGISKSDEELLNYLKEMGICSAEQARIYLSPESMANFVMECFKRRLEKMNNKKG